MLYGGMLWYREKVFPLKRLKTFWVEKVVITLDILDQVVDLKARVRERLKNKWKGWKERAKNHQALVHAILFGAILLYSAALRYADVFRSPAFGYSDPYSHLLWMKELESGVLYPSGILQYYPKGFHAFLAVLHGLTGLDEAVAVRLTGPLVGVLLVLAVYYAARKLTENGEAALIGMFIFGTFIQVIPLLDRYFENGILKLPWGSISHWFTRQTAALPEEFGLVFLMPALFSAYSYLIERSRRTFVRFCLSSITIFMIQPLIAIAFGVGLAALLALSVLLRALSWKTLLALSIAGFVTALLGNLQLLYGWFFSQSVNAVGEGYFTRWLAVAEKVGTLPYTLEILISGALGLLFLGGGILLAKGRQRKLLWSFLGLYLVLLAFLGRSLNFGIRYLLPPDRVGHYRILVLCVVLSGVYYLATLSPLFGRWYRKKRWLYQTVTALSLVVLGVIGFPSEVPSPPRYEYNALAKVSYEIKRSFLPLEWTIVSTVENYSKTLKEGWHMNVDEFLTRYSPYARTFDMPTPYTFLFVQKRPFSSSTDPRLKVPGVRLDLQRRLQEWSSIYNIHHNDMSIYYEDWDVIVYLIAKNHTLKQPERLEGVRNPTGHAMRVLERLKNLVQGWGS